MTELIAKVLLVEDSPSDARLIEQTLIDINPRGFEVVLAGRLDEALVRLQSERFDVVLLDLGLPDSIGIETLVRASAAAPQMPIVVLTGADDEAILLEAIRRGSQDYLVKSHVDGQIVANSIRYAIQRKKVEEELKSLNEELERRVAKRTAVAERRAKQLRQLAAELTLAERREQKRLAQILHDGLQQTLVAAKFSLALIEHGNDVRQAVKETENLINEAIEISRSLTAELSPPMLHQGGLVPSLKWLTRWFHDRHGLMVKLTARDDMEPMPEEVVIQLFQSIREILFNVVKHSGVQKACVEVVQREGRIYVSIEDDGAGFDTNHLRTEGGSSGGFGLFSISERVSFLGGQMDIQSAPGKGSRLNLAVPYSASKSFTKAYHKVC
jgi:signal transduction histidine kinase